MDTRLSTIIRVFTAVIAITLASVFAWVPVIGDPLTVVAGVLRIRLFWFLILATLGKLLRYSVLAYLVLSVDS